MLLSYGRLKSKPIFPCWFNFCGDLAALPGAGRRRDRRVGDRLRSRRSRQDAGKNLQLQNAPCSSNRPARNPRRVLISGTCETGPWRPANSDKGNRIQNSEWNDPLPIKNPKHESLKVFETVPTGGRPKASSLRSLLLVRRCSPSLESLRFHPFRLLHPLLWFSSYRPIVHTRISLSGLWYVPL